jgi:hypothetical protein
MRSPSTPIEFSPFDMTNPALRALVENWKSEIQEINVAEPRDFKSWWSAHVKETCHWGGGPMAVATDAT